MKKLPIGGSFIRSMAAGLAVFACVSVAKAHPFASMLTNSVSGGSNVVSFWLNESGGSVTLVSYPSQTTNSLGVLSNGPQSAAFPLSDTSYSISVTKTGSGTASQVNSDGGLNIWNNGALLRGIGANTCAQFGDSFGRIYLANSGQTTTDNGAGGPSYRAAGVYALTPDLAQNAIHGTNSYLPAIGTLQSNTLTIISVPAQGATFTMDTNTYTWTTNTPTGLQVAIGADTNACATNLAAELNATLALHGGTISVSVVSNVVIMLQYAQSIPSFPSYLTFAGPAYGPFAPAFNTGNNGFGSGPYRITVSPDDGTVFVTDATIAGANVFIFGRNIEFTNQVWDITGLGAGEVANEHGYPADVAVRGSLAAGTFQVFTAELDMMVPSYFQNTNLGTLGLHGVGNFGAPQETLVGDQNEIMRYDLANASSYASFPVTNTPNMSATLGLDGANFGGQVCSVALGPNTNYVYAGFRRLNFSDGNLQVFRADNGTRVYTSLGGTPQSPADVFTTDPGNNGCYGLRISPDGRFLASLFANSVVAVCNLTNGIPDTSTLFTINTGGGATGRQMSWDAADNLILPFTTAIAREYSMGLSTTCVTSNDLTGTNGSFQLILPPATATVTAAANASQNYVNEGGTVLPGDLHVDLGTSSLANPLTVSVAIAGTGANGVNYTIGTGTDANNVVISSNSGNIYTLAFPATNSGSSLGADLVITPTATPLMGPTFTVTGTIQNGPTYIKGFPSSSTVVISNTGPQLFFVTAAPTATTMSRAISNDYAEFVLNRWGDITGPGVAGHAATTITVTNVTLGGTAALGADYLAGAQILVPGQVPQDGSSFNIAFAPGVASITALVGNPVSHLNAIQKATNVTIIPSMGTGTNTNSISLEGFPYFGTTQNATLTELDNAEGTLGEVVLWSDPLTNSAGANYAVTYSGGNMAASSVLPAYIPNYQYTNGGAPNGSAVNLGAPSNYFDVQLGFPINNENSFESASGTVFPGPAYQNPPPSAIMAQNGWSSVLRMTTDKSLGQNSTQCGLNFYPTTNQFYGNYALRFDMYLSIWSGALNNSDPGTVPRQFAAFGINSTGTNCNWRVNLPQGYAGFNNPTNADGDWFAIDAGDSSLTPADWDSFISPALPNNGTSDTSSSTARSQNGIFKSPPFPTTDVSAGSPINSWSAVSVELRQTNVALWVDSTAILANSPVINNATSPPNNINTAPAGLWTNGVPFLGYLQPFANAQSDETAFVYYSNARIVELGPYILNDLASQLVLRGSTVTLSSTATYASTPALTNTWVRGSTPTVGTTVTATHTGLTGTNFTLAGATYYGTNDSLVLNNVQNGSNYWAVWSDSAGAITSGCYNVMVVIPPTSQTVATNAKATFTTSTNVPVGWTNRFTYQWKTNGVNLANNNKYAGATSPSLGVSNCTPGLDDAVTYTCTLSVVVTNQIGLFVNTNVLLTLTTPPVSVNIAPNGIVVSPSSTNALWGSPVNFNVTVAGGTGPFTYQWKHATTNLVNQTNSSLTVTANGATAGSYTVAVINSVNNSTLSPAATLSVTTPPPTISTAPAIAGGNVSLSFTSSNSFDASNDFILQSSPVVTGPYTNDPSASFTGTGGSFQVTTPQTANANMFYRLLHVP